MSTKENAIKQEQGRRLAELRSALGKTQQDFSNEIGLDRAYLAQIEMGNKSLSYNTLMNVTYSHKNLNTNWLLQGNGEMFIGGTANSDSILSIDKPNVTFYDIEALAGLSSGSDQFEHVTDRWYIPVLTGEHVAVNVSGNSMESTIFEGDKVIAKKVVSPTEMKHGDIYIFIYEGSPLIKRLYLNKGSIILQSDNPFYDDIVADRDRISSIFRVVMYVRIF